MKLSFNSMRTEAILKFKIILELNVTTVCSLLSGSPNLHLSDFMDSCFEDCCFVIEWQNRIGLDELR